MDTLFCKDVSLDSVRKILTELQVELLKKNDLLRECDDNLQLRQKEIVLNLADILESFHKLWNRIENVQANGNMDASSVRFLESFKIIEKQILNTYHTQGGVILDAMDTIADPNLCEIVDIFPTDLENEDGKVMKVITRGHKLTTGQVLRPSKVITYKFFDTN
jgi:molecular chaperone GrpE (heat shock protein)